MVKKRKSITSILNRIEKIEKELYEIRKDFTECFSPTDVKNKEISVRDIEFTMDDLYDAFGENHKSYAFRLRNALEKKEITTLSQFLSMTPGQLLDLDGVGSGTLQYVNKVLKKMGINW